MKIRIEGATTAELDAAEAALRRVFDVGEVSPDYRNRARRQGAERAPDSRRYFSAVTVLGGDAVGAEGAPDGRVVGP